MEQVKLFEGQEIVERKNFNNRLEAINRMAEEIDYNRQGVDAHHRRLDDHEVRIKRLEDALFNGLSKYTYTVSFVDLSGINLISGNWNKEKQRLEC